MQPCPNICFVTGTPQCGKTTFLRGVIEQARALGYTPGGFMALGLWENNRRAGFILQELESGAQTPLSGRSPQSKEMGGYVFYAEGFAAGLKTLTPQALSNKTFVTVDEIGWLETRGDGWAQALPYLVDLNIRQIWVVRDAMIDEVCATWKFKPELIVHPDEPNAQNCVLEWLASSKLC